MSWICDLDVCADIIQTNRSSESSVHEEVPATETINEEEEPDDCHDCFDDAENAGGKKRGVCACDADGFEDCGGVVVDSVDAGCVLPEEERAA